MIRGVKIVSIPVSNQDVALKFYTEKVGFKVATDQAFGPGQRWIELLIPGIRCEPRAVYTRRPRGSHRRISARHLLVRRRLRHGQAAEVEGSGTGGRTQEGDLGNDGKIQRSRWERICVFQQVKGSGFRVQRIGVQAGAEM